MPQAISEGSSRLQAMQPVMGCNLQGTQMGTPIWSGIKLYAGMARV
jgi:hypothetical protein|tara:strand:- start:1294 stop:1431 length:138 start_codon:yes stop_codon:yes gene_type:complete